ncbi:hypothetical protein TNCV_2423021 [Trichonephila clavipes]|nr:hypothetical protein TNCV_2423021 [Trichonephila clavipes]
MKKEQPMQEESFAPETQFKIVSLIKAGPVGSKTEKYELAKRSYKRDPHHCCLDTSDIMVPLKACRVEGLRHVKSIVALSTRFGVEL